MSRLILLALFWLLFSPIHVAAGDLDIKGVRLWAAPDNTRLVFDTSGPADHSVLSLRNPERLVIDFKHARLSAAAKRELPVGGVVKGIRSAQQKSSDLRIVLDLKKEIKVKSFVLKPNEQYGHRLVVDLLDKQGNTSPVKSEATIKKRELVIAIDAGHGGEDPGAKGRHGTREKDVVLSISRKLATLVNRQPGMRAVLIRTGDYFLPLRKRMEKARKQHADLFVSIHADAFRERSVRGSSVFVLSRRGASSEMARWLAKRENASDLVGGVSLDDKDELLAEVLLDLAQTATQESSIEAANYVFKEMRQLGKTRHKRIQKAGFMVLKSPDIPSMLVETAFISNPTEEKRLRSPKHQQKIARAIMNGLRAYFKVNPVPGLIMADSGPPAKHAVKRGDTLSHIASRYGVSQRALRNANKLKGDRLIIGKVLAIPGDNAVTSQPKALPQKYVIKRGDTLSHIAKRFGVSQRILHNANKIRGDRLIIGKVLKIPAKDQQSPQSKKRVKKTPPRKYVVKNGDTLGHIASRYGVSQRELRAANKIRGDHLLIGKTLTIPAKDS